MNVMQHGLLDCIVIGGHVSDGTRQIAFWRGQVHVSHFVKVDQVNNFINRMCQSHRLQLSYIELNDLHILDHMQFRFTY